ncbi:N-6 DNA methylase [Desulfobacterales bacterium HSG16]|nr:N-6 DNA methylase [Desulfobacterales bacterium HSG16]
MAAPLKRKQDEFQAFYTNCNSITSYMIGLLQCDDNTSILEPCAGEGVFIDEILDRGLSPDIEAYELNDISVKKLQKKYKGISNVKIKKEDFLLLLPLFLKTFDRVIANPPYGAYQSPEKRKQLKKDFHNIYARETYGLFLARAMEMLNNLGRLVFIVPDTYLTLHMHEGLRKLIIASYKIESITLFPSGFFPDVNFGYAGLSIISIVNEAPIDNHRFPVYKGLKSPSDLPCLLTGKKKKYEVCRLSYRQIATNPSHAFYLPLKKWITSVIEANVPTVGDICSVLTGFYSGNDAKYLRRSSSVTRGKNKYALVNENEICRDDLSINPPIDGIDNHSCQVPIVKGGNRRFYKPSEWFMDWSETAVHDYRVTNKKKARFQNSRYYFQHGIAVPMVSSSSITASLMDGRLFDQSIVGIFPHHEYNYLEYYLLGFFNSKVCNEIIRTINASTNNSANYIKKIPLIIPGNDILLKVNDETNRLLAIAKNGNMIDDDLKKLNKYFDEIYNVNGA